MSSSTATEARPAATPATDSPDRTAQHRRRTREAAYEQLAREAASAELPNHVRVAVIGSGFAGLGMAVKLQEMDEHAFVVLERARDVGGTWRDNTYPGAACDVPSQLYSFSFALNPDWSRSFSAQPEIFDYLRHVTTERGLWPHLRLDCTVDGAEWDEAEQLWRVRTSRGTLTVDVVVSAVGALSEPSLPQLPGLERFRGTVFHSARWRHDHDLRGERIGVVGTGASAIQFVPEIAPLAKELTVFQRTPPWIIPRMDRDLTTAEQAVYRRLPRLQRFVRSAIYWGRETYVIGFTRYPRLLGIAERLARRHLARQVPDSELRAKLTPNYRIGCKRILISNDWYPALSRPNVDVSTAGIAEVTERGIRTSDGVEHELDTIIFGTGFAVTEMPAAQWIRGRGGQRLADVWADGMSSYLGTTFAGFPNFFMLVGPNTGLGHTSQVYMIEAQIAYVADALRVMDDRRLATVEVHADAQHAFDEEVHNRMQRTVWTTGGCASWYLDARGRNTTLWPDFTWRFKRRLRRFDVASYETTPAHGRRPASLPGERAA